MTRLKHIVDANIRCDNYVSKGPRNVRKHIACNPLNVSIHMSKKAYMYHLGTRLIFFVKTRNIYESSLRQIIPKLFVKKYFLELASVK